MEELTQTRAKVPFLTEVFVYVQYYQYSTIVNVLFIFPSLYLKTADMDFEQGDINLFNLQVSSGIFHQSRPYHCLITQH